MRKSEKTLIGEAFPDAAGKVDRNWLAMDENALMAETSDGMFGHVTIAQCGDSMMGNASSSGWFALFANLRMLHYDFDATIDSRGYYEPNDLNVPPAKRPANVRGFNFGKGGTLTSHMVEVQLPFMLEEMAAGRMPKYLIMSPFQNDRWASLADARQSIANVLKVIDAQLAYGGRVAVLGIWPHTDLVVNGTAMASGKHFVEQQMIIEQQSRPGMRYIPLLELLKRGVPEEEAQGKVNYIGTGKGKKGDGSHDDIHAGPLSGRLGAPAAVPTIRSWFRETPLCVYDGLDFDQTRNPKGNYFGAAGRFYYGTTPGLLNGAANPKVPTGIETIYDPASGAILTPEATGKRDFTYRIYLSGIPQNGNGAVLARLTSKKVLFPAEFMRVQGLIRLVGVKGIAGIAIGQAGLFLPANTIINPIRNGVGSTGGPFHVMPFELNETIKFSSMEPEGFANQYATDTRMDIIIGTVAGEELGGYIEFSRAGLFACTGVPSLAGT